MGDVGIQGRVLKLCSLAHYTCIMFWISFIESKVLLKVQHNMSLKVWLPWQHTRFQTSPILKAFLVTYSVLFSYLQMVPPMYDPADI